MKPQLFPKEIIEYSTELHFSAFSVTSKAVYLSVIVFLIAALISLPFIYVDISVKSNGLIRPLTDKNVVTSPVSGTKSYTKRRANIISYGSSKCRKWLVKYITHEKAIGTNKNS